MTATPPRADLRTLAAEDEIRSAALLEAVARILADQFGATWLGYRVLADRILAAVLPEHEQQVAARERLSCWETLTSEARAWEATAIKHRDDPEHGDGDPDGRWANLTAQGYWSAANKLIPPNDVAALRRLAAAAPPDGLSAPVPAGTAPAVPEEAGGQRAGQGDALGEDLPGKAVPVDALSGAGTDQTEGEHGV